MGFFLKKINKTPGGHLIRTTVFWGGLLTRDMRTQNYLCGWMMVYFNEYSNLKTQVSTRLYI